MSTPAEISLDFSNLDGETDTDQPLSADLADGNDINPGSLQPHLPPPPSNQPRRNARERGVVIVGEEHGELSNPPPPSTPTVEETDIGDNVNQHSYRESFDYDSNFTETNGVADGTNTNPASPNGTSNGTALPSSPQSGEGTSNTSANRPEPETRPVQICYSKNTGTISVREGQVTTGADGLRYIATQQIPTQWDESEQRPLKKNRIRWIKILSIVACILFFPTGIPAAYYAFRVEREFAEGIMRGNIDRAQKFATRSERMIILSMILCILVAALVVTLIERPQFQSEHYHRGTVAG